MMLLRCTAKVLNCLNNSLARLNYGNQRLAWLNGTWTSSTGLGRRSSCAQILPRSPCAQPWALVKGTPGDKLELHITCHEGKKHLPVVKIQHVA